VGVQMLQKVLLLSPFRQTMALSMEQNCGKDDEKRGNPWKMWKIL
jgi:hypothetical protein